MKKTLFIATALLLFSFSFAYAQTVIIPYNVDYPYYYKDNSIDSIHACDHGGVHCQPDYGSIIGGTSGAIGQNQIPYTASIDGDIAFGFYPDSTLHVVGVAFVLYVHRGNPSSPVYNDALATFASANQVEASLFNPVGPQMQRQAFSTKTIDDIDIVDYKAYSVNMVNGVITNGTGLSNWKYMWEMFFDNEIDVADSFYVSVNVRKANDIANNECTGFFEYHTPAGGDYIWPRMSYRIKADDPNEDILWQYGSIHCYPMVFPIIRRDCDSCPPVREVEVFRSSATQVFVKWHRGDNHLDWQLAYGPAGTPPEDCTVLEYTQPISGLITVDPDSQYVAYVRARCHFARDEWGAWSAPVTIWLNAVPQGIGDIGRPDVTLSPNPAHGTVIVGGQSTLVGIEVYNPQGCQIIALSAEGTAATIDISALPAGVYTVRVTTATGTAMRRLAVE